MQTYDTESKRLVKTTGYNIDQWTGRVARECTLPDTLDAADCEAVARIHLPSTSAPLLKLVTGAAIKAESYLKAVEDIAVLARWKAKPNEPKAEHFEAAISEVVPSATANPIREASAPKPRAPRLRAADAIESLRPGSRETISQPESESRHRGDLVTV